MHFSCWNICPTFIEDFTNYRTSEGYWGLPFVQKTSTAGTMKPLLWWKCICGDTTLSQIPIAVLSMPVTSAATERVFSSHSNIHTKKRNRLDLNRSGKLTYCYHRGFWWSS
jgi:hypothetical protein